MKKPRGSVVADDYVKRGWAVVPVKPRGKRPAVDAWLEFKPSDTFSEFNGKNIGVILGACSGGLVDIDLDSPAAVALGAAYLPDGAVFGRTGKPASHYLYIDASLRTEKFIDPVSNEMIVEIRSDGAQTVFPGSTHESGESIKWVHDVTPPRAQDLRTGVRRLAAAALVATRYSKGARDDIAASLIGTLARARWSAESIRQFLCPVLEYCGDEEDQARLRKIDRTLTLVGTQSHVYGIPKLVECLGRATVDRLLFWLLVAEHTADGQSIVLRPAGEIMRATVVADWLHRPYLERGVIGVVSGAFGTYKSFLVLDWMLHAATGKQWIGDSHPRPAVTVVYVCGEGRGLRKRLLAWAKHHFPSTDPTTALDAVPFYAVEMPINLSSSERMIELQVAIDALPDSPALIVLDTLSSHSEMVEENNAAMQAFMNALSISLRLKYTCTVLIVHHTGYKEAKRPRGPSSLEAGVDCSYLVERVGATQVTLTVRKLKDAEPPPPTHLRPEIVTLESKDEDGAPQTSLVLVPASSSERVRVLPTSGIQRLLLEQLQAASPESGWSETELGAIARRVIPNDKRQRRRDAIVGLQKSGWLKLSRSRWVVA